MNKTSTSTQPPRRTLRTLTALCVVGLLVALASPSAAVFPHFKRTSVELVTSDTSGTARVAATATGDPAELPDVLFSFTLVGAGSDGGLFEASVGAATATFGCVNEGSKRPKAGNKVTVSEPLSESVFLASDANGRIVGSLLLETSGLFPDGFSCPAGQTVTALQIDLDQISLTETQSGASVQFDAISEVLWR